MILTFKEWLEAKNAEQKLLWATAVLKPIRKVLNIKMLYKVWNPVRFSYYQIVKGYAPLELSKDIRNGVYKVFIRKEHGEITVVKIPRKDTFYSQRFVKSITSYESNTEFFNVLSSLSTLTYIHTNIGKVKTVYRNGGYEANYINGYNLKALFDRCKSEGASEFQEAFSLLRAIEELIDHLESYHDDFGKLEGDWAIQNLMYDKETQKIVNVDLEGFYMYRSNEIETQLPFIKQQLLQLKGVILPRSEKSVMRVNKTV